MEDTKKKSHRVKIENIKNTLNWWNIKESWISPITIWCIYSQIFSETREKHRKNCNKIFKKFNRK